VPRNLLEAYAIRSPRFTFSIEDFLKVKGSPKMRLTKTPFVHDYEDKVFIGKAVDWKGAEGVEQVREINPDVADGLEKAISISEACEGVKGIVASGDRFLPKKVICQIKVAAEVKKGASIEEAKRKVLRELKAEEAEKEEAE